MTGPNQQRFVEMSVQILEASGDVRAGMAKVLDVWFRAAERHYEQELDLLRTALAAERARNRNHFGGMIDIDVGRPGHPSVDARIMDP